MGSSQLLGQEEAFTVMITARKGRCCYGRTEVYWLRRVIRLVRGVWMVGCGCKSNLGGGAESVLPTKDTLYSIAKL